MKNISIVYNPYRLTTNITIDGTELEKDSLLTTAARNGKRLQEWIGRFPQLLVDEFNCSDYEITFHGMALDYDDVEEAFHQAVSKGIIRNCKMTLIESESDVEIKNKILQIFSDLQQGPCDEFKSAALDRAVQSVNDALFPIMVVATMSSGKSTLINALLQRELMPAKNEACTATITRIQDTEKENFEAVACDKDGNICGEYPSLDYETMKQLNEDKNVTDIYVKGDIPFLDSKGCALELVDTPGTNNANDRTHKEITYKAIADSENLILYIMNGTQLSTEDDHTLLKYISQLIQEGGKQARDRFLFVVNKMDSFDPEKESIEGALEDARNYLKEFGIDDPQLFPCSAFTALNIRMYLKDIDLDKYEQLPRDKKKAYPLAARDAINLMYKFEESEELHLERYSTLTPAAQADLERELQAAIESGDLKAQTLIHSGIRSIEEAITAYVKKYALTKKVKDLVETFEAKLESSTLEAELKQAMTTDKEKAEQYKKQMDAVNKQIISGKETKKFRERIDALNPIPEICEKAEERKTAVLSALNEFFIAYKSDTVFHTRTEVKELIEKYSQNGKEQMMPFITELETLIDKKVNKVGQDIIEEYRQHLKKMDSSVSDSGYSTFDLVKGKLGELKQQIEEMTFSDHTSKDIDDCGETTIREEEYYEKVGEEEIQVEVGTRDVKVGTERVKVGSHMEVVGQRRVKVGTREEWAGTRKVKNPEKKWYKFFTPKYIEEDIYRTVPVFDYEDIEKMVDDFEERDIIRTEKIYATEKRDKFEKRTRKVEVYNASLAQIQLKLTGKIQEMLEESISLAKEDAAGKVGGLKKWFKQELKKLDDYILDKTNEIKRFGEEMKKSEEAVEHNQKILNWLKKNEEEINNVVGEKGAGR